MQYDRMEAVSENERWSFEHVGAHKEAPPSDSSQWLVGRTSAFMLAN